ncbi:MAG: diaminopimelate epimerase [Bacteroidales bacterium]|nr:diaminopimelate epimerase [Bacteroidales bacterium]
MKIHFYKYEGAGNDFIIIDNRDSNIHLTLSQINFLCQRHFGIGSDGLMFFNNSEKEDFAMEFYNPDGSGGMMCGNGGRCIVRFAKDIKAIQSNKVSFLAPDGKHTAEIIDQENVCLKMKDVEKVYEYDDGYYLNTGTSHFVKKVKNVNDVDVFKEGKKLRWDSRFEKYNGCNVNFYTEKKENELLIRTFERGVEGETLACGTGIVATAIAYITDKKFNEGNYEIVVKTQHNELKVCVKKELNKFSQVYLIGPAKKVYQADIEI